MAVGQYLSGYGPHGRSVTASQILPSFDCDWVNHICKYHFAGWLWNSDFHHYDTGILECMLLTGHLSRDIYIIPLEIINFFYCDYCYFDYPIRLTCLPLLAKETHQQTIRQSRDYAVHTTPFWYQLIYAFNGPGYVFEWYRKFFLCHI